MKKVSCKDYYTFMQNNIFNNNFNVNDKAKHSLSYPSDNEEIDEYTDEHGNTLSRRYEKLIQKGISYRRYTEYYIAKED